MRFVHICLILAIANATKFLDETTVFGQEAEVQITYDQSTSLFTEEQLAQNTEVRMNKDEPFDYQSEQISPLQSVEQQQILLAYEKDLLPQGDCVILYAECQFKGTSKKVCKGVEEVMSFSLPVFSIYVPELQQFSTIDVNSNTQVTFLTSDKCLDQPIVMADSQLDFFIAKSMSNWIGESAEVTQLIQQEQVENQNTAVEQQTNETEQVDQQVQQQQDVNVEQQLDQSQTEQQPDQSQTEQQVDQTQTEQQVEQTQTEQQVDQQQDSSVQEQQTIENEQQSEQQNENTQQSTEQSNQSENQETQENTITEQNQENQTQQTDQSQEQVEQQPEVVSQDEKLQEKEMEEVVETVTEIVQQVEEKQEVELESEKEQLQQEEEAQQQQQTQQQTEQSVDDIPQNQEPEQQYSQTETAEPLVGQSQYTK
ncbi:unnamed protein product [Paramecium pentaurelia]|uniref:Uncharacterized protein n=1 Tax=Paramecium pentaurelia TaxID=43138 RepID=A0A8S1WL70_9CILI|nr:unnamed protein product [Paramecium pentaurelia]